MTTDCNCACCQRWRETVRILTTILRVPVLPYKFRQQDCPPEYLTIPDEDELA